DGIRALILTGVQTCALPIYRLRDEVPPARRREWQNARDGRGRTHRSRRVGTERPALAGPVEAVMTRRRIVSAVVAFAFLVLPHRSEERRVGKGCRSGRLEIH